MKRLFTVLMIILLSFSLTSCGDATSEIDKTEPPQTNPTEPQVVAEEPVVEESTDKAVNEPNEESDQEAEQRIKELIKGLLPTFEVLEPDSIGSVYAVATFANTTNLPIVGYQLSATLKDTNESTYFTSYQTVLPGTISPNFSSFGPLTGNSEDIDMKTLSVTVREEDHTRTVFEYDIKLDKLTGYSYEGEEEPPIDVSMLIPNMVVLPPDSIGQVYVEAELVNNTELPLTGYTLAYLLKDTNEISYLTIYETTLPGETTSKFTGFGPETGDLDDMELRSIDVQLYQENGKTVSITYDILLESGEYMEYEE